MQPTDARAGWNQSTEGKLRVSLTLLINALAEDEITNQNSIVWAIYQGMVALIRLPGDTVMLHLMINSTLGTSYAEWVTNFLNQKKSEYIEGV